MSLVNVRNCIRFYQTAEELNASTLLNYCAEIIASHWVSTVRRKKRKIFAEYRNLISRILLNFLYCLTSGVSLGMPAFEHSSWDGDYLDS